jgi:glycine/D-amino acid oxidase-like deaminating enzyme
VGESAGARAAELACFRRHLFVTEPVPELDRNAPYLWFVDHEEMYVRPEEDGYLLCACDSTPTAPEDARPVPEVVAALAGRLAHVMPGLAGLPIARSWACLRTFTQDGRPRIEWDPERRWLFWVAGLGGHGATSAAAIGQEAAAAICARLG